MTKIEWTEKSYNYTVGCSVLSPGCKGCYAMGQAARLLDGNPATPHYAGTTQRVNGHAVWTGRVNLAPEHIIMEPLRRRKPTMYFVNSMSDLFHESVPDKWIDRAFAIMALCPQHTFQVLTKRSKRMRDYMQRKPDQRHHSAMTYAACLSATGTVSHPRIDLTAWPLANVWLGVSCEDQTRADERIPDLLATPAAVRFVSAEPLLEAIEFRRIRTHGGWYDALAGWRDVKDAPAPEGVIDWIIVGGESGPNARPMHPDWARSIRDQCEAAGTAFFFKQWGSVVAYYDRDKDDPDWRRITPVQRRDPKGRWLNLAGGHGFHGERVVRVTPMRKDKAGRLLDGVEHNAMPKVRS